MPVAVAGNVGTALTTLPGALDDAAVIVLEASSFQLEDTLEFAPDAAVLLNLAPTTSTATAASRPTATRSCGSSPPSRRTRSPWCRPGSRRPVARRA